jgi:hypothetical protein
MVTVGLACVLLGGLVIIWASLGFLRGEATIRSRRTERAKTIAAGALIAGGALLQIVGRL